MADNPPWRKPISWTLASLLALAFVFTGVTKLLGYGDTVQNFEVWGYPFWFRYVVGVLELISSVIVIVPATRRYGAALIACVMLGALLTHLRVEQYGRLAPAFILLVLSLGLGYLERLFAFRET